MDFSPSAFESLKALVQIPLVAPRIEAALSLIEADPDSGYLLGTARESTDPLISAVAMHMLDFGYMEDARIAFNPSPAQETGTLYIVVVWIPRDGSPYILFNDAVTEGGDFIVSSQ